MAVVGGGISGLAAAYTLAAARTKGRPLEEYIFDGASRLGGVILTDRVDGCVIEAGPDSFLTEKPQALELAKELGIDAAVIGSNDAERKTYVLHRHKLATLPDGLQFLVPTRLLAMATTPLVPFGEKLKILGELFHQPRPVPEESVSAFVLRHFGSGMLENIADPLLAGVYGGDSDQLSVRATLPRFVEMEQKHGSLIRAVLEARKKMLAAAQGNHRPPRPLFSAFQDGLSQLVAALEQRLDKERIYLGSRISGIEREGAGAGARYCLLSGKMISDPFDAIIAALPAHETARLVERVDSELSAPLAAVPYSSSLTVALGYRAHVRRLLPSGFGFLVPRKEGRRTLACTFVHTKFPSRVPPDRALLRCFLGGTRDEGVLDLSDQEVSGIVRRELKEILGLTEEPVFARIYRWRHSMAQYTVGHQARVAAVRERLRSHAGLFLAGNWDSGIGISDCIRSGRAAAADCLRYLEEFIH